MVFVGIWEIWFLVLVVCSYVVFLLVLEVVIGRIVYVYEYFIVVCNKGRVDFCLVGIGCEFCLFIGLRVENLEVVYVGWIVEFKVKVGFVILGIFNVEFLEIFWEII